MPHTQDNPGSAQAQAAAGIRSQPCDSLSLSLSLSHTTTAPKASQKTSKWCTWHAHVMCVIAGRPDQTRVGPDWEFGILGHYCEGGREDTPSALHEHVAHLTCLFYAVLCWPGQDPQVSTPAHGWWCQLLVRAAGPEPAFACSRLAPVLDLSSAVGALHMA